MKPRLRERKPSLKYKFYDEYESEDSEPPAESDPDEDINYCHECDSVFTDIHRLHKHLLIHIKQPQVSLEKLSIATERAPIRITLKGCGTGDFEVVQSPTSEREFPSPLLRDYQTDQGSKSLSSVKTADKTDDDYEEKYIIPDSDPVAGGSCGSATGISDQGQFARVGKTEPEEQGHVEEQEEEEEENAMNVSFSPNYATSEMVHEDNSEESQHSSIKTCTDGGYSSGIPGADPTPPPEPPATPDYLMPKIRIKSSGLLMAPERESPQGLTITEITEGDENNGSGAVGQEQVILDLNSPPISNISSVDVDPFAGVESWSSAPPSGVDDPLRLPDTIETDGNIISNLFTNNTDRAKDLGLTSSDSEFISLDGMGGSDNRSSNNNNAMAVYNPTTAAAAQNQLLPTSVSNALVGLPMQQLAQQVSRLQPQQGGQQQMHQQNVLINIQQFPQAPQHQQPQQVHMQPQQQQVQPYGMYHHQYPGYQQGYGHPQAPGAYGQPYAQPNLYYAAAPPPAYPVSAPAQHMPPPPAPQQPAPAYIVQTTPQQQQPQQQQPIILGAVSQLTPGQGQQAPQPYGQQQGQHQVSYVGPGGQQQQHNQQQQGGQPQGQQQYNQVAYSQQNQPNQGQSQQTQGQNQQSPQQPAGNRMPAIRPPPQAGAPRMGGPRGPPMVGTRAPYSQRGGAVGVRSPMNRGRGAAMIPMRGRPRAPGPNSGQNGMRQPMQQQGNSPIKRTPEQMAAIAAKRRRMESMQSNATVKVEQDDDEDDCELVSVQQKAEAAKLPKIQSVQGAVADPEANSGVMHLSDSITLSIRQPPPKPPSPKAKSDAKQVANVLAARGITVTAAPKDNKHMEPVPISLNKSVCLVPNKSGKKDDHSTPTVDLTDDVRVPPPKTLPAPNSAPSTNGTTSTVPPPQPFKCDQCPARYGTNIALVKHRQAVHKTCNQMDYGVPLIDLRQPGIMSKLTNFGIYNYIPLPAANVSGMFALPVISMNAVKNNVNLSALGNSMLTLGPIRKIQKAGGGHGGSPNTTQQSPPRGRPPSNPSTPTKQL